MFGNILFFKVEIVKENGYDYYGIIGNIINGNGVYEMYCENLYNYDDFYEGQLVDGEEDYNDRVVVEINEDDSVFLVLYYGRIFVVLEYMNFYFEEIFQKEKIIEDDNDNEIVVVDVLLDDLGFFRVEVEIFD